jgi:chromosomal replication initiation ATPase DnaA
VTVELHCPNCDHRLAVEATVEATALVVAGPPPRQEVWPDDAVVNEILQVTCDHFLISIEDLLGHDKRRRFVRPRQIAMAVIRECTAMSYPDIAKIFDGRDHTTALHSIRRANATWPEKIATVIDECDDEILATAERASDDR